MRLTPRQTGWLALALATAGPAGLVALAVVDYGVLGGVIGRDWRWAYWLCGADCVALSTAGLILGALSDHTLPGLAAFTLALITLFALLLLLTGPG